MERGQGGCCGGRCRFRLEREIGEWLADVTEWLLIVC